MTRNRCPDCGSDSGYAEAGAIRERIVVGWDDIGEPVTLVAWGRVESRDIKTGATIVWEAPAPSGALRVTRDSLRQRHTTAFAYATGLCWTLNGPGGV